MPDLELLKLEADVKAIRKRIADQRALDPDHEVALAMFDKDLQRALSRVARYELNDSSRTYVDGRRVA